MIRHQNGLLVILYTQLIFFITTYKNHFYIQLIDTGISFGDTDTQTDSVPGGIKPLLQDSSVMLAAGEPLLELTDSLLELVDDSLVVRQGQVQRLDTIFLVGFLLLCLMETGGQSVNGQF